MLGNDNLIFNSRTSITKLLWEKRREYFRYKNELLKEERDVISKTPKESFNEVYYLFKSNEDLCNEYIDMYGTIRLGKILEDLDAMAGNIANIHADDNNPTTRPLNIVTASLDRIDLLSKMELNNDMKMSGCVSYAGRSSLEVRINLESFDHTNNRWQPLLLATFTMVALSNGKPVPINKIEPETETEKLLYQFGEGKHFIFT